MHQKGSGMCMGVILVTCIVWQGPSLITLYVLDMLFANLLSPGWLFDQCVANGSPCFGLSHNASVLVDNFDDAAYTINVVAACPHDVGNIMLPLGLGKPACGNWV